MTVVHGEATGYVVDHEDGTKLGSPLQGRPDSEGPVQKPGQRQRVGCEDHGCDAMEM